MLIFNIQKRIQVLFAYQQKELENIIANTDVKNEKEAFVYYCMEHILKLSGNAIKTSITHGEMDGGIDAVHINEEGVHILICDYAKHVRQVYQSFLKKKIKKSVQTMRAIFSSMIEEELVNKNLQRRIKDMHKYWERIPGTYVPHTFYFITNKKYPPGNHVRIEKQLDYYMTFSYFYMGLEDLHASYISRH